MSIKKLRSLKNLTLLVQKSRQLSTCTSNYRREVKYTSIYCAKNPLVDGPDYTYLDGRKTPLRANQISRHVYQRDQMTKAFQAMKDLEYAKKRYQNLSDAEKERQHKIMSEKFVQKGK